MYREKSDGQTDRPANRSVDSVDCSDHALIRWPVVSDPPTTPSVTCLLYTSPSPRD